jgi:Domain of unknown function (DUF4136)
MLPSRMLKARGPLLAAAVFAGALFLVGCDEYVRITRDPDLRLPRHATWAWQTTPERPERAEARESRRVISRDVIGRGEGSARERGESVTRENDPQNEVMREKVKTAIEQTLMAKGFKQVTDPGAADFVVDFHLAMQRRNVTVAYPGAYPGLVCGPYGCWEGWGGVGYEHIRFREGTIVIDAVQEPSNHLVYRAVGEKPVKHDLLSFSQNEVNEMVRHLLKDLKPRGK